MSIFKKTAIFKFINYILQIMKEALPVEHMLTLFFIVYSFFSSNVFSSSLFLLKNEEKKGKSLEII